MKTLANERVVLSGGSAVASDSIYREVQRVKEAGKPIIVSMGNVAASGGYYISAPATKIVASPATITGSIGVAFGKFNFDGILRYPSCAPKPQKSCRVAVCPCESFSAACKPCKEVSNSTFCFSHRLQGLSSSLSALVLLRSSIRSVPAILGAVFVLLVACHSAWIAKTVLARLIP